MSRPHRWHPREKFSRRRICWSTDSFPRAQSAHTSIDVCWRLMGTVPRTSKWISHVQWPEDSRPWMTILRLLFRRGGTWACVGGKVYDMEVKKWADTTTTYKSALVVWGRSASVIRLRTLGQTTRGTRTGSSQRQSIGQFWPTTSRPRRSVREGKIILVARGRSRSVGFLAVIRRMFMTVRSVLHTWLSNASRCVRGVCLRVETPAAVSSWPRFTAPCLDNLGWEHSYAVVPL